MILLLCLVADLGILQIRPFNQEEEYPEEKIVRKVERSLPTRFSAKVVAIEKAKNMIKLPLDNLLGSANLWDEPECIVKGQRHSLEAEVSIPNNTLYSKDEIMMLT